VFDNDGTLWTEQPVYFQALSCATGSRHWRPSTRSGFIDDKSGKPVGIQQHIGRRPIAAFGNSDGDLEMLEWTTRAPGARLGLIVHHDDSEREFAYDRKSHVGQLDRGLNEAGTRRWTVTAT